MVVTEAVPQTKVLSAYRPIPASRQTEFWNASKIAHLRKLSETAQAVRLWTPPEELSQRPLDRLRLREVGFDGEGGRRIHSAAQRPDTSVSLAFGRLSLSSPLYLGDMSFGALSGVANVALARAADLTGVLAGTGEGGLHREVAKCRRIAVQWASGRFGVDINVLNSGLAVVIKIGQGAKVGIGGHLPGAKVTEPISATRRIPVGTDAISPAPHHDIYSIEDLGQRIWALKEATGKPVLVKVGVTNYIPYIASGVARMGADGIIMDGSGAGTGAAPSVIKDNVGIPIELAVAAVDRTLRKENLRKGFSVIAAGRISNAEDTAKIMALGADCCSIGTAALVSMGCLMVRKCHLGFCPALLTNRIASNPAQLLSIEKATEWSANLIRGWTEELRLILEALGLSSVKDLVGRKDLLQSFRMSEETSRLLGVDIAASKDGGFPYGLEDSEEYWTGSLTKTLREMAGTIGKAGGDAVISSMGNVAPPFVGKPRRICDWMASDGAQVTRPSIDPYREEIDVSCFLAAGRLRLSCPVILGPIREPLPIGVTKVFARVAVSMGLVMDVGEASRLEGLEDYSGRMLIPASCDLPAGGYSVIEGPSKEEVERLGNKRPLYLRIGCNEDSAQMAIESSLLGFDGVILDSDLNDRPSQVELEIAVSEVDYALRGTLRDGVPLRNKLNVLAVGSRIRGSADIFKICGLGADAVGLSTAALISMGYGMASVRLDDEDAKDSLENLVFAVQRELKLLAGAAGVSNMFTSLVGNRELFRSLDLETSIRLRLGLKPAGVG